MRNKALRRRVWFKALDRIERNILSLTIRIVDRVESAMLGVELVKIIMKLKNALKSKLMSHMDTFGYCRAVELAQQAKDMGSSVAAEWAVNIYFIRFLSILDLNLPTGFGY